MPQIGAHFVIAEKLVPSLPELEAILDRPENLAAYHLGAVGPDMFYYLYDNYDPSPALSPELVDFVMKCDKLIDEFRDIYREIGERFDAPGADLQDWLTGGLSTQLHDLVPSAVAALKLSAAVTAGTGTVTVPNPFAGSGIPGVPTTPEITVGYQGPINFWLRTFGHPYGADPPFKSAPSTTATNDDWTGYETRWWWVDVLHYRRTGQFAAQLLKDADTDFLKAYAHGYFTHVAGDVVGHAYVNALVGGPYRTNVIRHLVMENIMDTWVWDHFHQEDLAGAGFHKLIDVGTEFGKIADLLLKTMHKVYVAPAGGRDSIAPADNDYPGTLPRRTDLTRAYQLLWEFLEHATTTDLEPPTPPPSSPAEFFAEVQGSLGSTAGNVGSEFPTATDNPVDIMIGPFLAGMWAMVFLIKLATLPAGVLARVLAVAPRWLGFMMQQAIFDYVNNLRWQLALNGIGKASSRDLSRTFATECVALPASRTGRRSFNHPHKQTSNHNSMLFWVTDPASIGTPFETFMSTPEMQQTGGIEACPYPPGAMPDIFIDGPEFDPDPTRAAASRRFATARTPEETIQAQKDSFGGPQLGNAVKFAEMLIRGQYPAASFDLDSDMGYGFLGWDGPKAHYDPENH